jgi:hypothetical protein
MTPKKDSELDPLKPNDLMDLKERLKTLLETTAATFVVELDTH